ncbi:MAG: Uma2 family endonuclease [Actinomycetota bacterium]|nr:Uma2 family endonuclease [Actinomycetota bacterium]
MRGELRKMAPPAGDEHGYVTIEIGWLSSNRVKANNLGRVYHGWTRILPGFLHRERARTRCPGPPEVCFVVV